MNECKVKGSASQVWTHWAWPAGALALVGSVFTRDSQRMSIFRWPAQDHVCARILPQVRVQKSMDNLNTKQDVERIRRDVLENLRQLSFAPGASAVQHQQCDTISWQCSNLTLLHRDSGNESQSVCTPILHLWSAPLFQMVVLWHLQAALRRQGP